MKLAVLLISWLLNLKLFLSIKITPQNNNGQKVQVKLNPDPRGNGGINKVIDNEWKLDQDNTNNGILYDWGMVVTFDGDEYGFKSGSTDSRLIVSLDGRCGRTQCDGYFAFDIGGSEYVIFVIDFDGQYYVKLDSPRGPNGIFGLPQCGASNVLSGDVSSLMSVTLQTGQDKRQRIRDGLANGDNTNWHLITNNMNKKTFPVTFTLINDDVNNKFTVQFKSATTSFTCSYNSAVATGKEIKMFFSPDDVTDEIIFVKSIEVLSLDECGYEYVSEPKSYNEAQDYCKSTYGRNLAEIQTRQDRDCAIYKTGDGEAPWNGIHSIRKEGFFEYFDENTKCPLDFSGACVDFWRRGVPDCKNGYKCTVFYTDYDGTIDNDKDCDTKRPFLCNDEAPTGCINVSGQRNWVVAKDNNGKIAEVTSWESANNYCQSRYGTTLSTIITQEEASRIDALFETERIATGSTQWIGFLIGLNDRDEEGNFVWVDGSCCEIQDGSGLCTSLWRPGSPDNNAFNGEDCAAWFIRRDNKDDLSCGISSPIVCNAPSDGTDNGHIV